MSKKEKVKGYKEKEKRMARGSGEEGRTTSNGQCLIDAHRGERLVRT